MKSGLNKSFTNNQIVYRLYKHTT